MMINMHLQHLLMFPVPGDTLWEMHPHIHVCALFLGSGTFKYLGEFFFTFYFLLRCEDFASLFLVLMNGCNCALKEVNGNLLTL